MTIIAKIEQQKVIATNVAVRGPSGPIGATGATGPTGSTGIQGASGSTGLTGATGSGLTGATGIQGASGASGPTGATGSGLTGATGIQGASGASGLTGATGPQGIQGASGASGIPGYSAVGRIYWLKSQPGSDISGYEELSVDVSPNAEDDMFASSNISTGENLIVAFATNPNEPGLTTLPAGEWEFHLYRYINDSNDFTEMIIRVYLRNSNGDETEIFNTTTGEINDDNVAFQIISYVYNTPLLIEETDRIVVKFFANSLSYNNVDVHLLHDGSIHASHIVTPITIGIHGASGSTGPTGATGIQGASGTGATGLDGATGLEGATGSTGIQGASGSTGLDGATGSQGVQGSTGSTGIQGASGSTGLTGATGPQGIQGATGSTGIQGASGSTGIQGASGSTGVVAPWTRITSTTTLSANSQYIIDTSSGPFSVSLPATPVLGTVVVMTDGGNWNTNNLTVLRNGSTINGLAQDLTMNVREVTVFFIYDSATWQVTGTVGAIGATGPTDILRVDLAADKVLNHTGVTTASAAISDLTFTLDTPNAVYGFNFIIAYRGSSTAAGIVVGLSAPASTTVTAMATMESAADGTSHIYGGNLAPVTGGSALNVDSVRSTSVQSVSVDYVCTVTGLINNTASGTFRLLAATASAGTTCTLKLGSQGSLWRVS